MRQISRPAGPITVPELYEGPGPGYLQTVPKSGSPGSPRTVSGFPSVHPEPVEGPSGYIGYCFLAMAGGPS